MATRVRSVTTGKRVPHPSLEERRARGMEARDRTPLSSHSGWTPAGDRPDPVGLLEEQNVTREPDLVPARHGRMLVSPFTFHRYRGGAKIMASCSPRTAQESPAWLKPSTNSAVLPSTQDRHLDAVGPPGLPTGGPTADTTGAGRGDRCAVRCGSATVLTPAGSRVLGLGAGADCGKNL